MLPLALALILFSLSSPVGAHTGSDILLPMVPDPAAMVIDGEEDDWYWFDPILETGLADMDTRGSAFGYWVSTPGVFVDPSDYAFTYRIAWSPPPDNRLYFFIRIRDDVLDTVLPDPEDWWRQDFLQLSIDADHSGGVVLGETPEEISNGQRYVFRVQPPREVRVVQQAHSLEPRFSWSAGADWFDAAWTVRQADDSRGFIYAIEFSCALWDEYGPTVEESVRHRFAAGQVIHLAPRAGDSDGGPPASAERYLTFQLGGNLYEDRHAGNMADFTLVDSPSDYGSVSGQVTYSDDGSPRANALVFLQGGMDRKRTFTDQTGRYRFQSVPGTYEVYASGGFGARINVDVVGGRTVSGVDFSPAANRDSELADPGRIVRQLQENPQIIDEPVVDYGSLPPLLAAAHRGYLGTVDVLLERGADADATDRTGRTLLQRLTASSQLWHPEQPVMRRLVSHGATVDLKTALSMGHAELVGQLVTAGGRWQSLLDATSGESSSQIPLFDGTTLDDWTPTSDLWRVENGEIVCPTSDRIQFMISDHVVDRPFSLHYQLSAIERSHQDGKMVGIIDAAGNGVLATIDDEIEHTVQIASGRRSFDDNGVYGPWQLEATAELPMQLGKWYDIQLTIDGKKFTVAAGDSEISCGFEPQFPVFIWLEVQRSGAKYRELFVTAL